jgi:hypothetical protein
MHFYKIYKSQRDKPKMTSYGFCYTLRRENQGIFIWRCEKSKCTGAAKTENNILIVLKDHNHEKNTEHARISVLRSEIKNRALTTKEAPFYIFNKFVDEETQGIVHKMPKVESIIDRITKTRKAKKMLVKKNAFLIPEILRNTINCGNFTLLEKKNENGEKFIIFTTYTNLIHLEIQKFGYAMGHFIHAQKNIHSYTQCRD